MPMPHPVTVDQLLDHPDSVWNLMPATMNQVTRDDARYHAEMREHWIENNQMRTVRNEQPHHQAAEALIQGAQASTVFLELGSGVGFDAGLVVSLCPEFKAYLLSEIDPDLVRYAKESQAVLANNNRVVACCLDGNDLLLESAQIDRVMCVAALHHMPDLARTLAELNRVTRPSARLVFAIEPNRRWLRFIAALRPLYRILFASKSHSAADEKAEGFTRGELNALGKPWGWTTERVIPVWFLAGFLHYGLEAAFRILRLRKRLIWPRSLERLILNLDRLILVLPGFKHWSWHYTAIYTKDSNRQ